MQESHLLFIIFALTMITRKTIEQYFDEEAEASRKAWQALMDLPLEERIRKRKAVDGLRYVPGSWGITPERMVELRFGCGRNLSDFKEGDQLLLHPDGTLDGMTCTLTACDDENTLTVEVYARDMRCDEDGLEATEWVLDKANTDLRPFVYNNFCAMLTPDREAWAEHPVNRPMAPTCKDKDACDAALRRMMRERGLSFTAKQREAILNSMAAQDLYLIQGPPGTGKSFVLGVIILEEMEALGRNVIVVGPNHAAVNNALTQVLKTAPEQRRAVMKVGQTVHAPQDTADDGEPLIANYRRMAEVPVARLKDTWVIGLTPHSLYTSRAGTLRCHTLVVDEAGQVTIPLGLMGMIKAEKVILAGDHKQLPPIIVSDKVSGEMRQSIFQRLMTEENHTMLDTTFRMCGPICDFVSALFYEGRLRTLFEPGDEGVATADRRLSFDAPIVLLDVDDEGVQVSEKEAEAVAEMIEDYLRLGLSPAEVGVLAPFRAQAAHIRRLLKARLKDADEDVGAIAVDTVDKMQGQERSVIIYSFTAGDPEYMTEMAEFLYNPNKLNVAFSRAKRKLVIVGNMRRLMTVDHRAWPHILRMLTHKGALHLGWTGRTT